VPDPFDNPDVVLLPPPAVPDFAFQGIAVGAPLDTPTPKPAEQRGFIKDEDKPFQPFAQWAAAVRASGVPSADALARGITSGSGEQLRALARSFTASAAAAESPVARPAAASATATIARATRHSSSVNPRQVLFN